MNDTLDNIVVLIGRLLMAFIFVVSGYAKIASYAGTAAFMEMHHVPGRLLPLVIAVELGGGVALALGLYTRVVATVLALFSLAAIALFLLPPVGEMGHIVVMTELAMTGGLLGFGVRGGGTLSVDGMRKGS